MAFATEAELGYDPNVNRVRVDGEHRYNIRVGSKVYQTLEVLTDYRASRCIGQATRVWKVMELGNPEAGFFALKDTWLGEDARSEQEIQQDIIKNVNKVNNIGDVEDGYADMHFIKIYDDVGVDIDGNLDITSSLVMRNTPGLGDHTWFQLKMPRESNQVSASVVPRQESTRHSAQLAFVPVFEMKQHRRLYRGECILRCT